MNQQIRIRYLSALAIFLLIILICLPYFDDDLRGNLKELSDDTSDDGSAAVGGNSGSCTVSILGLDETQAVGVTQDEQNAVAFDKITSSISIVITGARDIKRNDINIALNGVRVDDLLHQGSFTNLAQQGSILVTNWTKESLASDPRVKVGENSFEVQVKCPGIEIVEKKFEVSTEQYNATEIERTKIEQVIRTNKLDGVYDLRDRIDFNGDSNGSITSVIQEGVSQTADSTTSTQQNLEANPCSVQYIIVVPYFADLNVNNGPAIESRNMRERLFAEAKGAFYLDLVRDGISLFSNLVSAHGYSSISATHPTLAVRTVPHWLGVNGESVTPGLDFDDGGTFYPPSGYPTIPPGPVRRTKTNTGNLYQDMIFSSVLHDLIPNSTELMNTLPFAIVDELADIDNTLGNADMLKGNIIIRNIHVQPLLMNGTFSISMSHSVIAHELGHILGLDHVNQPSTLLYPTQVGTTEYLLSLQAGTAITNLCSENFSFSARYAHKFRNLATGAPSLNLSNCGNALQGPNQSQHTERWEIGLPPGASLHAPPPAGSRCIDFELRPVPNFYANTVVISNTCQCIESATSVLEPSHGTPSTGEGGPHGPQELPPGGPRTGWSACGPRLETGFGADMCGGYCQRYDEVCKSNPQNNNNCECLKKPCGTGTGQACSNSAICPEGQRCNITINPPGCNCEVVEDTHPDLDPVSTPSPTPTPPITPTPSPPTNCMANATLGYGGWVCRVAPCVTATGKRGKCAPGAPGCYCNTEE